jgi:diacylglycerol kinase family enzyme
VALGVDTHAAAAEAVAAERYERVDVGEVNDRVFVNGVSIGLYPRSLRIRREWEQTLGCTRKRWSWSC